MSRPDFPAPNMEAAQRFLATLTSDTAHTFQTFDDAKRGRKGLTRILHGTFGNLAATLADLNRKGAGIFVVVNRTDLRGRAARNVIGCRALFLDLDGSPIAPVLAAPIPPRITVESSPDRWHAYWTVVDLPSDRFRDAQKALAAAYGGDHRVHDLPRVMRVPGFIHAKAEPFVSRLVTAQSSPLTWHEMAEAFDLPRQTVLPNRIPEGTRNATLFRLALAGARKGTPEAAQLSRLQKVNEARCDPPVAMHELRQIVANAYSGPQTGAVDFPLAVLDSDAYRDLSNGARTLVLIAHRRADRFTEGFSLAWSDCTRWFPRKNTFLQVRKEVLGSGLIEVAREATKPAPGRAPKAALYKLSIGALSATYSTGAIGAKSATPEALQALANGVSDAGGLTRRRTRARRPPQAEAS